MIDTNFFKHIYTDNKLKDRNFRDNRPNDRFGNRNNRNDRNDRNDRNYNQRRGDYRSDRGGGHDTRGGGHHHNDREQGLNRGGDRDRRDYNREPKDVEERMPKFKPVEGAVIF